ncbi:Nn.00g009640.m01.CDS01 [Neocucurbitaria sp. VM-36]
MKLIITGASGFVATEVLRQALLLPSITSVVAVARNSVSPPNGIPAANATKLKSVVVPDYATYPEDARKELEGANACIWTVAITPSKARDLPTEIVRKVCQEWTLVGLKTILDANPSSKQPFRFLYMSGSAASDPANAHSKDTKAWMPQHMVEYSKMRGETATQIFELAAKHKTRAEVCVAKPGFITGQSGVLRGLFGTALWLTGLVDTIDVKAASAAMLHQVVRGFEGTEGVLTNAEMVKLGKDVLANER